MTPNASPRTAAEIRKRLEAIGNELARGGRFTPVSNARQLNAEEDALKIELRAAEERESEAALVAQRVEAAMKVKAAEDRERRITSAVERATR